MGKYKYQSHLNTCASPCPDPATHEEREIMGFRSANFPVTEGDFVPTALLNRLDGAPSTQCSSWGLSFHKNLSTARSNWRRRRNALARRGVYDLSRIGTHIVEVQLKTTDGVCTKPRQNNGHFNLHEYNTQHQWAARAQNPKAADPPPPPKNGESQAKSSSSPPHAGPSEKDSGQCY